MQTIWKTNWQLPNPWALGDKSEDFKKVFVWSKMFSNSYNNSGMNCCWWYSVAQLFVTPWTAAHQASLSFTISWSLLKFMSFGWWCHPTISSSVIPFSSCLQSFPASESFLMSQFFASGGQSIGASALVPPMNIQDWFPLVLTGLISFQSKELSRVFSSNTVQRHQFFGTQPFFLSSSHVHTWLLEKP